LTASGSPSAPVPGVVPLKRTVIFSATPWEMQAVQAGLPPGTERSLDGFSVHVHSVGGREYWLAQTGMGLEKARQRAMHLVGRLSADLIISTGFACALVKADIGALLVGLEVIQKTAQSSEPPPLLAVPGSERTRALAVLKTMVPPEHIGRFVSTDRVVGSAREKHEFAKGTEAIGLDMESSALAIEAKRAQVPFVIIRSVSDLVDEDLPLDFNLFLRPTGWLKGIGSIVIAPSRLFGLGRLRRQSMVAAQALTDFFRRYVVAMAAGPQAHNLFVT